MLSAPESKPIQHALAVNVLHNGNLNGPSVCERT